jgi:hypothetical protein
VRVLSLSLPQSNIKSLPVILVRGFSQTQGCSLSMPCALKYYCYLNEHDQIVLFFGHSSLAPTGPGHSKKILRFYTDYGLLLVDSECMSLSS